jgi:hypothetical protein
MELVPVTDPNRRPGRDSWRLASKLHRLQREACPGKLEKDTPMGLPAILIATAISLTMLVMVSDLP